MDTVGVETTVDPIPGTYLGAVLDSYSVGRVKVPVDSVDRAKAPAEAVTGKMLAEPVRKPVDLESVIVPGDYLAAEAGAMGKAGVTLAFAKVCHGFCPPLDLWLKMGSLGKRAVVISLEEMLQGKLPLPLLSLSWLLGLYLGLEMLLEMELEALPLL
ncbi:hypothetical protein SUGI_1521070 [Cryptomeria japonica]|uniref:Uncharacterized protein n=1 Tax=Cryptomeria japonica TaxID=3369 RepID=A0AAD3NUF2_CRYJA|nr:hypothetical protein SUGI_1478400 [Cryptomeria japonica]GLJ58841.1 hypothetical protein SUGI_1480170 [Cryptomeria japonica]GLJ59731.1 hypothetical protein SUGI_1521070 [Cryptomeria japonica]